MDAGLAESAPAAPGSLPGEDELRAWQPAARERASDGATPATELAQTTLAPCPESNRLEACFSSQTANVGTASVVV